MENKRGTKRPCSPSTGGSPSPSEAKTPLPVLSRSAPPPGSPSEITSCCPRSPVFEQGSPSRNILVIELSSSPDEEGFFANTARDMEFTKWLFGDLNPDLLGPPDDDKEIIISDSNEEKEAHEETTADVEVTPSTAGKYLTPTSSAANVDEDPWKMQDDNSDDLTPSQDTGKSNSGRDEAGSP
jgi:hypothetical protein